MNIYRCKNAESGKKCVYMKYLKVDNKIEEIACTIKQTDTYNLYPEFDTHTGNVINQNRSTTIDDVGPKIIYENLTGHQNGLTFDYRSLPADIHPNYTIIDYNIPLKSGILDFNTIGDIFGDDNLTLVSSGWSTNKVIGFENIEKCKKGIFGSYNSSLGIVMHKSMRDYNNLLLDWTIYTKNNNRYTYAPKILYIESASDNLILTYLTSIISDYNVVINIYEALQLLRDGGKVNFKTIIENNNLSDDIKHKILKDISLYSYKSIYKYFNIQKIFELYSNITNIVNNPAQVEEYRCNIINYVLNNPNIKNINIYDREYNTDERIWFLYLLLKRASKVDKILKYLPKWTVDQINYVKSISSKNINYIDNIINDIKKEKDLYPAMIKFTSILNYSYKRASKLKKHIFHNIIKAGVKWNATEIQNLWKVFCKNYKTPLIFWNYIFDIEELDNRLYQTKIVGEGSAGEKRTWVANLIKNRLPYNGENNFRCDVPPIVESTLAGARHTYFSSAPLFWKKLKQLELVKNINNNVYSNNIEILILKEELEEDIYNRDTELDIDEFSSYNIYDNSYINITSTLDESYD